MKSCLPMAADGVSVFGRVIIDTNRNTSNDSIDNITTASNAHALLIVILHAATLTACLTCSNNTYEGKFNY